jgi:hypothetical protein
MARRNQKKFNKRTTRYNDTEQRLVKKLDLRKLNYFNFDAKEILNSTDIEQKVWSPLLASIVTKASRLSIKDAKEYIYKLEQEEVLDVDTAKALSNLLDRYKRWR